MDTVTNTKRGGIFVALIPWLLFSLLASRGTVEEASVAALLAAAVIAFPSISAGRPKILELGAVATFAVLTVVAFGVDASAADVLARYARGIAAAVLAAIAFGSLLFTPFTEQYARESVPESAWSSPAFKAVNRQLTAMWGCVFAALVPLHVIAGAVDTAQANRWFNWIIPVLLIVWAVKRTGRVADATHRTSVAAA